MHIQCSSLVCTTALDMKLIFLVSLIACSYADKLDRTYLPPASAGTAGGSPGAISAPGAPGLSGPTYQSSQEGFKQPGFALNIANSNQGNVGSNFGPGAGQQQFGQGPESFEQQPERERASIDRNAEILRYDNENDGERFAYSFETSNGISAEENGVATNGVQAQGGYSYTGDDGQKYSVTYTADENGYQPQGEHLPTPHPIPDEILKSLEKNAQAAAEGTQEGAYNPDEDTNEIAPQGYNNGAPSFQPEGISGGNGPASGFGPGSQASNSQGGYPRGPAAGSPTVAGSQGFQSQSGQGPSGQYGAPNALPNFGSQGYPSGPALAGPNNQFGSQGAQFGTPAPAAGSQGYPRGPIRSNTPLGSQVIPSQNGQRPSTQYGAPTATSPSSGQGYSRGPTQSGPNQSASQGFPSQNGKGPASQFGAPSAPGYTSPSAPVSQGYPRSPQSSPANQLGSQGQKLRGPGSSQLGAPSTSPSSQGYPRGPASAPGQTPSQGFPSQRGQAPSTQYGAPSQSGSSRFNQAPSNQPGSNQPYAPLGPQGGDSGYQYNRPNGPSVQGRPNQVTQFQSPQYGSPAAVDSSRPTSTQGSSSQYGAPAVSSRPSAQNYPQQPTQATSGQGSPGYPSQTSQQPSSQYGSPATSLASQVQGRPQDQVPTPQYGAPSSSPVASTAVSYPSPATQGATPQFGTPSTFGQTRPANSGFAPSGSNVQPQDKSGYQYNRPQTQFGDSQKPTSPGNQVFGAPSSFTPQGTRPTFAAGLTPTSPIRAAQGNGFSRPLAPAQSYPSGPASTASLLRPSSPPDLSPNSVGFPRPNNAVENIPGNVGTQPNMPQSAPYQYSPPSQGPVGPGSQASFGTTGQLDVPAQIGSQSFGTSGQNRPGQSNVLKGQVRPGQEFGGPRQPPSFSPEEGYKY